MKTDGKTTMSDLQQRMAEKIDGVIAADCGHFNSGKDPNTPGGCKPCHEYAKRIAERLMPVVREAQAETLREAANAWWQEADGGKKFDAWQWLRTRANQMEGK